jgi:hypothetical protein
MELVLNVACHERRTIDITTFTSNHVDVVACGGFGWREEVDAGQ